MENRYYEFQPLSYLRPVLKLENCVRLLLSLDLSICLGAETHISGTFYLLYKMLERQPDIRGFEHCIDWLSDAGMVRMGFSRICL